MIPFIGDEPMSNTFSQFPSVVCQAHTTANCLQKFMEDNPDDNFRKSYKDMKAVAKSFNHRTGRWGAELKSGNDVLRLYRLTDEDKARCKRLGFKVKNNFRVIHSINPIRFR